MEYYHMNLVGKNGQGNERRCTYVTQRTSQQRGRKNFQPHSTKNQENQFGSKANEGRDQIMIFKLYTIKDELSEYLPTLMPFEDDAQAKRWFREHVAQTPMMRNNPEDYSLWNTSTIDTKTGAVIGLTMPELIERAKGVKNNGD